MTAPHWALLPIQPWRLADVAAGMSATRAMNVGGISLMLLSGLPFVAIAPVANPSFGLIAGKPAWIHDPWIRWVASPLMLLGFLTSWLASAWLARTKIRAIPDDESGA